MVMPQKRSIPMNDEMIEALKQQKENFETNFGRAPGPNDPVFFNPGSDVPEPMLEQQIAEYEAAVGDAMRKVGVDPAVIYAFEQTGFFATEENWSLLGEQKRKEWRDAIAEYEAMPKD